MKTKKLVKKSKTVKVIGKGQNTKQDKLSNMLKAKHARHLAPRSRSYMASAYFLLHKPVENKVYDANVILKGNTASLNYIGAGTRDTLLKMFSQPGKIEAVARKEGNANLYKTFKFLKK